MSHRNLEFGSALPMTTRDRKRLVNALRTRTTWDGDCLVYVTASRPKILVRGKGRVTVARVILAFKNNLNIEDRSWVACHGPCDNKRCVRPSHLYTGTHRSNAMDAVNRSQFNQGTKHGMAKLTEDNVRLIRSSSKTNMALSKLLGVSYTTIYDARNRRSWRHV